jgi:diguanylate cyclase (GGDEF)-like protein
MEQPGSGVVSARFPDWRGGVPSGPREDAYRQSALPGDLHQSRFVVAIATLGVLLANLLDLWLDDFGPAAVGRLWLFGWQGTLALLAWLVLGRVRTPRGFDLVLLAWLCSYYAIALVFRAADAPLTTAPVIVLLALGGYALLTHRLLFRAVPVLLLTIADLGIAAGLRAEGTHEVGSLALVYLFVHLAGGWVALDREGDRRQRFRAQLAEAEVRRELERLAHVDALTGVLARRRWLERAEAERDRFHRHGQVFAILMLDLDHFKLVNDRYGHQAGDVVLQRFARLLQSEQRRLDVVGRLGGEEFAVLLPETDLAGAEEVAERVVAACRDMTVDTTAGPVRITCSIGIAVVHGQETIADLLHRSDLAMLAAKRAGRDQVAVAAGGNHRSSPPHPEGSRT